MTAPHFSLRSFHNQVPGCTSQIYGTAVNEQGLTSYQSMARLTRPGDRILDFGCGDGTLLEALMSSGHRPESLVGADFSRGELACARVRLDSSDIALCLADGQRLPFRDASFDIVCAHLVLMLLPKIDTCLKELARVLKPGGRLVAMLGGGPSMNGQPNLFEIYLDCLSKQPCLQASPPLRINNRAFSQTQRTRDLFDQHPDFDNLVLADATYATSLDPEAAWRLSAYHYEHVHLSPEGSQEAKAMYLEMVERHGPNCTRYAFALRLLTATKRP